MQDTREITSCHLHSWSRCESASLALALISRTGHPCPQLHNIHYKYIRCRKGIWSLLALFFFKKPPAAERSVSRGRILANMASPKKGQFWGPDSPGSLSRFSFYPSVPKAPFFVAHPISPKHLLYSVSGLIRPIFEKAPKMPKALLAESVSIWCWFGGGDFCTIGLFFL